MIEIHWGKPLTYIVTDDGDIQKFSTIEQAKYWLRRKWPVADVARAHALKAISGAMDCILPVEVARNAFAAAARSAGFQDCEEQRMMAQG